MSDIHSLTLFFGLAWLLIITPGPDLIYVLTRGISMGRNAGLISAVGVTLGILVHTIFAALGLSLILKTSAFAFFIVKAIGAGYLIYLGFKSLLSKNDFVIGKCSNISNSRIFTQGLISNTLNPKVALFFIAFLPQFININGQGNSTALPFVILGLIFAFCTLIFLGTLGYFSGAIGQHIIKSDSIAKWIKNVSGSILILLGIRLAFINQK